MHMHRGSCGFRRVCFILSFITIAFVVAVLLRNSHRIPASLPLGLVAAGVTPRYADTTADSEMLFAGFNNESGVEETIIPDCVHFVLFGQAGRLDFTSFLCILSAIKVHHPSTLYLHSDSPLYVGNNSNNRYWLVLVNTSNTLNVSLLVRHLPRPSHVYGQRLSSVWHASDVARLGLLRQHGGLTLDRDQLVLKSLHHFRHYEMALGWPEGQFIGTQLLMAHPRARLLGPWLEGYRRYRPSMWYYNAAQLPTQTVLTTRPELVHRVRWKFGVQNLASKLYGSAPWPEWHQLFSVHLLSRHKYLLSDKEQAALPGGSGQLDEFSVQTYQSPYGEMARHILYEVQPRLASPTLWPGAY